MENIDQEQEPATPVLLDKEPPAKILDTKIYSLPLLEQEYELTINLTKEFLEFKVQQKNIITDYYYKAKLDLQKLNNILFTYFKETKEVFIFYDKMIKKQKVKLVQIKEKDIINLYFKNIVNFDEEKDTNIELEKYKLKKDDIYLILLNEINFLKKKLDSKNEKTNEVLLKENEIKIKEYIDKKINETKQEMIRKYELILEEKIKEKDNEMKILKDEINKLKTEQEKIMKQLNDKQNQKNKETDKYLKLIIDERKAQEEKKEIIKANDNINLFNDFTNIDVTKMKNSYVLADNLGVIVKSVSVYKIIRDNKILNELAYPDNNNDNGYNIIIYNLLTNTISNRVNNAHNNYILQIKHYYYASGKKQFLLSSSKDKSIKLWNISSEKISCFMNIENCFDGHAAGPFCMMFNNDDYYIFGGSYEGKKNIWNKNGVLIGNIEKSNLNIGSFIEATYIDNNPYIILSGQNHSELYDYNNNNLKKYISKNNKKEHLIANLFKNNNKIYLICGDSGGNIMIFDFYNTNEIISISVGNYALSLCSINEKYILVGKVNGELDVIDFNNKSIVKKYQAHNMFVYGIEKFKTEYSQEFIITYNNNEIKVWQ